MKFDWEKKTEKEKADPVFMSEDQLNDYKKRAQAIIESKIFD